MTGVTIVTVVTVMMGLNGGDEVICGDGSGKGDGGDGDDRDDGVIWDDENGKGDRVTWGRALTGFAGLKELTGLAGDVEGRRRRKSVDGEDK